MGIITDMKIGVEMLITVTVAITYIFKVWLTQRVRYTEKVLIIHADYFTLSSTNIFRGPPKISQSLHFKTFYKQKIGFRGNK